MTRRSRKAPPRQVRWLDASGRSRLARLLERVRRGVLDLAEDLAGRRAEHATLGLRHRQDHADRRSDRERDRADSQRALLDDVLRLPGDALCAAADLARDAAGHVAHLRCAATDLIGDVADLLADLVADAFRLRLVTGPRVVPGAAARARAPAVGRRAVPAPLESVRALPVRALSVRALPVRALPVALAHRRVRAMRPHPREADSGQGSRDRVLLDGLEDPAAGLLDCASGAAQGVCRCAGHVSYLSDRRVADGAGGFLHEAGRRESIADGFDRPCHLLAGRGDVGLETGRLIVVGHRDAARVHDIVVRRELVADDGRLLFVHRNRSFAHSTSSSTVPTVRWGTRSAFFNRSCPPATISAPATPTMIVTISAASQGASPASTRRRTSVARSPSTAA